MKYRVLWSPYAGGRNWDAASSFDVFTAYCANTSCVPVSCSGEPPQHIAPPPLPCHFATLLAIDHHQV